MTYINTNLNIIIIYPLLQNLPSCVTIHLNGCDQHMTILRRLGPLLQWNVIVLDIGIEEKYVVQPWYKFLEESDFYNSTTNIMNKFGKLLLEVKRIGTTMIMIVTKLSLGCLFCLLTLPWSMSNLAFF